MKQSAKSFVMKPLYRQRVEKDRKKESRNDYKPEDEISLDSLPSTSQNEDTQTEEE